MEKELGEKTTREEGKDPAVNVKRRRAPENHNSAGRSKGDETPRWWEGG